MWYYIVIGLLIRTSQKIFLFVHTESCDIHYSYAALLENILFNICASEYSDQSDQNLCCPPEEKSCIFGGKTD